MPEPAGRQYWRSFAEFAGDPDVIETIAQEFPQYDPDEIRSMSRRQFLQLAGASMALAGLTLTGCRRWPQELVVPYNQPPSGSVPGVPEHFASMVDVGGIAKPLMVASYDGRPIKIDGNPDHPMARGASDAASQAGTLEMYDPERSRLVLQGKGADARRSSWAAFAAWLDQERDAIFTDGGRGLAIFSEVSSSPTLARLRGELAEKYPQARWYSYEPVSRVQELEGARIAYDRQLRATYDLAEAKVIACFDADLLGNHPGRIANARGWAAGRLAADDGGTMNRVYVAEPSFTVTGSNADVRLPVRASRIPALIEALAHRLGVGGQAGDLNGSTSFIDHLVADLKAHPGAGVVAVGSGQPAETHALVWAINAHLGNLGRTVLPIEEPTADQWHAGQLQELTERLNAGEVHTLVLLDGNPVYDAPAELRFSDALGKAERSIRLGLYRDETSLLCSWHLNRAHYLESWGDGLAFDGSLLIQQPLILPLYDGRSPIEALALLLNSEQKEGYQLVRQTLLPRLGDTEEGWRKAVHDGFVSDSAAKTLRLGTPRLPRAQAALESGEFELSFRTGPLYDGRYANSPWLQECPEPMTKLTWDNPLLIGLADAERLGLQNGDWVEVVNQAGATLKVPVYLVPGQAAGALVIWLGYGRTAAGSVGGKAHSATVGYDAYALRTREGQGLAGVSLKKAGGSRETLAATSDHFLLDWVTVRAYKARIGQKHESGSIVKEASLSEYRKHPLFARGGTHGDVSLQLFTPPAAATPDGKWPAKKHDDAPEVFNDPHAWGAAVDMNTCLGCGECVVACQAENNIPTVGKQNVLMNREMHWLRIDRYFKPTTDESGKIDWSNPDVVHMPMSCVNCENAPCEQVCPVAATVHDAEGLNTMVYNRCIGTRYCSNNCPYKVRRFNYLDFHARTVDGMLKPWLNMPDLEQDAKVDKIHRMVFNPDVTVRMRGVMEKCTSCIQRIKRATIKARNEYFKTQQGVAGYDRDTPTIRDGEVVSACSQACPTGALVFGDLNDPNSRVSKIHRNNRAYTVLAELNTRARTRHLAKIRNPVV